LRWTKRVIIFVAITRMRFPRGFLLSRRGELTSGRDRHNYLTRVRRVAGRALDLAGNGGGSSALQVVDLEVVRHPVHGAEPAHADPTELRCRLRKKVGSAMCAHRLGLA